MPYSAVSQPPPFSFFHCGRRSSTLAVHSTRVSPKLTSTEPSAWRVKRRWNDTGRSWSGARPDGRTLERGIAVDMDEAAIRGPRSISPAAHRGAPAGRTRYARPMTTDLDTLVENFQALGDWEERYRYLIDIGRKLPPLPEADRIEANKVRGCMSQVWLVPQVNQGPPLTIEFRGDSDAHIVKGLVALLFKLYSGRTPEQIAGLDLESVF